MKYSNYKDAWRADGRKDSMESNLAAVREASKRYWNKATKESHNIQLIEVAPSHQAELFPVVCVPVSSRQKQILHSNWQPILGLRLKASIGC